jgi:hypothetical protein
MRPTDKARKQDMARGQSDRSILYVSLELSRSTWLMTSLSPSNDKMSKHAVLAHAIPRSQVQEAPPRTTSVYR